MIRFACDYDEGSCPQILAALAATNLEQNPGYGEDPHCDHARALIREAVGLAGDRPVFLCSHWFDKELEGEEFKSLLREESGHPGRLYGWIEEGLKK